jgi:Putative zinc-finger
MTPDFSCERCQDSLPWYITNSLSNDERAAMERHLASCGRCRAALEEWRDVDAALHRADERIPLDTASLTTWANISSQLREQIELPHKANERTTMGQQDTNIPPPSMLPGEPPAARPHRRVPALVSLVAAVALIALSIGVFSLFSMRGSGHGSRVTATPRSVCAPSQATANLPAHSLLTAIAPLGTDGGWALGRVWDPQSSMPPVTLMLRLQNCHWNPVGTPIPMAELLDISMTTADDGWAIGATMKRDTLPGANGQPRNDWLEDQLLVLHYTGGSWQQVKVTTDTQVIATKVKMVSPDEGWMLLDHGKRMTIINNTTAVPSYAYSLLHYQNGTWTNMPLSFLKPSMQLLNLDTRQPGDVWLVGYDTGESSAIAAHYANGFWTQYSGTAIGADADQLFAVTVVSSTDVWIGGNYLYHFDGTRWTKASIQGTIPAAAGNTSVFIQRFSQIAMLSPRQGWTFPAGGCGPLCGDAARQPGGTPTVALRYDHGVWQWTTLQVRGATTNMPIYSLTASSPTQGWALGLHMVGTDIGATGESTLLYYDAGNWGVVRQQP